MANITDATKSIPWSEAPNSVKRGVLETAIYQLHDLLMRISSGPADWIDRETDSALVSHIEGMLELFALDYPDDDNPRCLACGHSRNEHVDGECHEANASVDGYCGCPGSYALRSAASRSSGELSAIPEVAGDEERAPDGADVIAILREQAADYSRIAPFDTDLKQRDEFRRRARLLRDLVSRLESEAAALSGGIPRSLSEEPKR